MFERCHHHHPRHHHHLASLYRQTAMSGGYSVLNGPVQTATLTVLSEVEFKSYIDDVYTPVQTVAAH